MSKLMRQNVLRRLVQRGEMASQDDLRRALLRHGLRVTQATLSRDLHELGVVKTGTGYALAPEDSVDSPALPTLERLVREFVREVRRAQNQVVLKTTVGSAQPVAAAIDGEEWPEVVGTIGGDDTILIISPDKDDAVRLATSIQEMMA
ncbi:MAG: ArgR family transcriptional regulator [Acidobacteriaceae bacterium]|nr:ArgR family transcriptional regulator [Acidobacteriaceae bacterium]